MPNTEERPFFATPLASNAANDQAQQTDPLMPIWTTGDLLAEQEVHPDNHGCLY